MRAVNIPERGLELVLAGALAIGLDRAEAIEQVAAFVCQSVIDQSTLLTATTVNGVTTRSFCLDALDDVECRRSFRFTAAEIEQIEAALDLPPTIQTEDGSAIPRQEALCILLRGLASPSHLDSLAGVFERPAAVVSSAVISTAALIHDKIETKMRFDHRMVHRYKRRSADAVFNKVGRLDNCLGFVDAIALQFFRPVKHARHTYSACKKMHCLRFQMVTLANGMIVSLFGPIEGRRGDCHLFRESGISEELAHHPGHVLYGDVGDSLTNWPSTPNAGSAQTDDEESFNQAMSRARGDVDWVFGWIVGYWNFFKLASNMKVFETPVGMLFVVAAFLTNCISCVRRRNQATKNVKCALPTLEIYLADLLAPSGASVDENAYISDDEFSITCDDDSDIFMDDSSAIDRESESGDDSMSASSSSSDQGSTE